MSDEDARFRVLFHETGMGIALVDLERRILDVNPAFEKMLGYRRPELLGRTFAGLMYSEDNPLNLKLHEELLGGIRDVYHMERRYIRKDGSLLWSRLTISMIRDATGKASFTMGVMEDITEQKIAAAKLNEMERGLAAAAKMSALGEMAGGIAHEIQNPLTIIRFRAELLKMAAKTWGLDPGLAEQLMDHADQIEKTSMRISSMVKGLKSFIRQGEQDPFQKIPLKALFQDAFELSRDRFYNQEVELQIRYPAQELTIECRPTQLLQVLVNLLNNAFDAVQGLPKKWVRLSFEDHGPNVLICVTDSGNGIPEEVACNLFQRFFTTKPPGKGTGLGLNLSRDLAVKHNGSLTIDSACANTRFVLELPKEQPNDSDLAEAA